MPHQRTVNGSFSRHETPRGCMKDIASQFHVYIRDYQGKILTGIPHGDATGASANRHKFGGKGETDPKAADYRHLSPWAYCAGDPVNHSDPTGKQTVAVHGTWSGIETWKSKEHLEIFSHLRFGNDNHYFDFSWSGGNYHVMRIEGADRLINYIRNLRAKLPGKEPLTLIGHSHGGNVIIEGVNKMMNMPEFNDIKINIVTINTPVRPDYQLNDMALRRVTHINVYDPSDPVQVNGDNSVTLLPDIPLRFKPFGEYGPAGRVFKDAYNVEVLEPQGIFGDWHNSHNRVWSWVYEALYNTHK